MAEPAGDVFTQGARSLTREQLRRREVRTRIRLLFLVLAIAALGALAAGTVYVIHWDTPEVYFLIVAIALFPLLALYLRLKNEPRLPAHVVTVYVLAVLLMGMFTGGIADLGLVYMFPLPIIVFLIHERGTGRAYVIGFLVIYAVVVAGEATGLYQTAFSLQRLLIHYAALLVVAGLTGFYQRTWEQNRDAIEQHLFTDMLTGLPNRRRMLNDLATVSDPVLYLINPDYFNQINDVFGARVGDRVLVELARTLEELIPSDAHSLYKLHADEFALVLVQNQRVLSDDDITTVAERLSRGLGEHSFLGSEYMLRVGVSIGIANTRVVGREKLLPRADIALKTAKAQHKPWMLFKEAAAVETRFRENITRLAALTTAIQEKRIAAYYQPIFESSSGALHKYECLARMVQQDGSVVGPGHFLDLSKKARLYQHITGAVLEAAFDTFRDVSREFSINLSVLDILNRDTNALIKETIAREPEVAARLVIELLESEQIEELAEVRDFASEMRKSGVRIAIDDFGSGYSNFAYTASLKLDYLKIDGSLIRNVCTSQEAVDIVGTIVEFARKLGSRTIAEFVSDGPTFDRVKELGVDYCQGFFLGKPVERVERDAPS